MIIAAYHNVSIRRYLAGDEVQICGPAFECLRLSLKEQLGPQNLIDILRFLQVSKNSIEFLQFKFIVSNRDWHKNVPVVPISVVPVLLYQFVALHFSSGIFSKGGKNNLSNVLITYFET